MDYHEAKGFSESPEGSSQVTSSILCLLQLCLLLQDMVKAHLSVALITLCKPSRYL